MSSAEEQPLPPPFGEIKNSAVSLSGNATTYNIQGNQQIMHVAALKPWIPPVMQPPRAANFIGREEDLDWLLDHFYRQEQALITICGPGGMGKTALVAEAVARLVAQPQWENRYPGGIFYYSFYPHPSLDMAFEHLARTYEEDPGTNAYQAAVRALSRERALLIFDGVEVVDDARPLRALGGQHTIVFLSRRQSDAPDPTKSRLLGVLSKKQGLALLQTLAGEWAADPISAKHLVHLLDGYPLAIYLVGRYLRTYQQEVGEYVLWYEEEGLKALHHGEGHDQSVPILLKRTYDALLPDEQSLFLLLGMLAPTLFPAEVEAVIQEQSYTTIQRLWGKLVNVGIIQRQAGGYEVSHALIHTFAVECIFKHKHLDQLPPKENVRMWHERLVMGLQTQMDEIIDPYDRQTFAIRLPHILFLLNQPAEFVPQTVDLATLLNNAGFVAHHQARFTEVESLYKRALSIWESMFGRSHPETTQSLNNLASLYIYLGKYEQAEFWFKQVLATREQQFGEAHPETTQSLNNLAFLYKSQGNYIEAKALYDRARIICEQALEPNHPDTVTTLNNLATLYQAQGMYAEAESLYQQTLAINTQLFGPTHPRVATGLNNLAILYRNQEKYTEAEVLFKQALVICEQALGLNHPHTVATLNNLAEMYEKQGKFAEAEPMFKRSLAIREQESAPGHPHTIATLGHLVMFYINQENYTEAEPLLKRLRAIQQSVLGPNHLEVVFNQNVLAVIYAKQKKHAEAEPLFEQALTSLISQIGEDHPLTQQVWSTYLLHQDLGGSDHQKRQLP